VRNLSGHEKKEAERVTLTCWSRQREEVVTIWKERDAASGTHLLETGEGGTRQAAESKASDAHSLPGENRGVTCQYTERKRPSQAHSRTKDGREWDFSRHVKKAIDRRYSLSVYGRGRDLSEH
jgi:hypothetical protein